MTCFISDIRYVDLETYRNHLRQKPITIRKGKKKIIKSMRKDSTVNREMSCLHHLITKGVEWEMIDQNPFNRGKSLILKENNMRLRFLTEGEIAKLLNACIIYPVQKKDSPKKVEPDTHLLDIVECAINTGMRKKEILSLKWDQIRNGMIYLSKTKTNETRQVPINDTMKEVFKRIRRR